MSAAPIIVHDLMFTLLGVYSFGAVFTVTITFEGRGGVEREGFQVLCRTPADML